MKKTLLSAVALVAMTVGASAADLPRRTVAPVAPIVSVPVFTWTGFYVGVQAGYATGNGELRVYDTVTGANFGTLRGEDMEGFVGGAHIGYNVQFGAIVVGIEGDIEGTGIESTLRASGTVLGLTETETLKTSIDFQASLRARVGFAFDRALIYATGGVAYGDFAGRYDYSLVGPGVNIAESVRLNEDAYGYTLGAGVEYAFTNNLTARIEYRYTSFDLGRFEDRDFGVGVKADADFHTVRAGVSYKF